MSLNQHQLGIADGRRNVTERAICDRLQPIVVELQRRADADAHAVRSEVRERLSKSPHVKAVRDAARVSLGAMRGARAAICQVVEDPTLSDAGKAGRLGELGADLDRSLGVSAKTVADNVAMLRAAAPQPGFPTERPSGVASDLGLRWAAFPYKTRSAEVEDGVKMLQTAMDPSTPADARANALWTLDGYHLPAMWRTARDPERDAKSMSGIAGDLGSAICTHLNVALGHTANQETTAAADSLARDYQWLSYQRDGALDDVTVKLVATSLFVR